MYESHWKVDEKPFEEGREHFYYSKEVREALTRILYSISEAKRLTLLLGASGAGKTHLLNRVAKAVRDRGVKTARVPGPSLKPEDMLRQICMGFKIAKKRRRSSDLLSSLRRYLRERAKHGRIAVIFIDDAASLTRGHFAILRSILNLVPEKPCLSIVLAGHTSLLDKMSEVPGLLQRAVTTCNLPYMSEEESREYIMERVKTVGGSGDLFGPQALKEIYRFSHGNPRLINYLCDLAMVLGCAMKKTAIDKDIVLQARAELKGMKP